MSSYTKATNFASKDALASGNPLKIVKGTEIDNEFNAIVTAVNSKIEGYNTLLTGTPTAPTAAVASYTTQLATTAFVHDVLPRGIIMLWSGSSSSIPSGWALCNGSSSTPDLRDRFIVGAGSTYAVAATGGSASVVSGVPSVADTSAVALTTAQIPLHGHPWLAATGTQSSFASFPYGGLPMGGGTDASPTNIDQAAYTGSPDVTLGHQIGGTGGGETHSHTLSAHTHTSDNLPPYYALCYIMKTTGI